MTKPATAADVVEAIEQTDFSGQAVTLVGCGTMGRHYLKAFAALGVSDVRVCSRSTPVDAGGAAVYSGGFENLDVEARTGELGVVATPMSLIPDASRKLAALGFRRLLIEKPVALESATIQTLADDLRGAGVEARVAYNRMSYPSLIEVAACAASDGGITSCTYSFTEMYRSDWLDRFSPDELARWGVANSLHVIGMAHRLIGPPRDWRGFRAGRLEWHPAGSVFIGAGVTREDIPFSYHADWTSTNRWCVEVHTAQSTYRLCPLEEVSVRSRPLDGWQAMPTPSFAPDVKAGVVEQVAAMMAGFPAAFLSPPTLDEAAELTRYAEAVFGYGAASD